MKSILFWLRLTGVAILLHIALIALSVAEVAVYSYLVNPGHDATVYEAHAQLSAPWISMVFGSLFVFLLVRRYLLRNAQRRFPYAIGLPAVYSVLDLLILLAAGADLSAGAAVLIAGKFVKFAAALAAYYLYSRREPEAAGA